MLRGCSPQHTLFKKEEELFKKEEEQARKCLK
jgi:hypothetical protein